MGCPTTVNGYTASWTRGKLSRLSKGNVTSGTNTYNYSYNAFGQRIGSGYKYTPSILYGTAVAMGTLTGYNKVFRYDQSGRLIYESKTSQYYGEGSGTEKIVYLYDESGIIGMMHTTESGTTSSYYFQRNLLGDVIAIYDTAGTKVGGYAYDAWGNCTITLNTNSIATKNPIRYRGYYYDEESGLYYLNARYYSPTWRRFISPDDTAYLDTENSNGLNLYTYCNNDPVNYADPSGNSVIASILIGFAISSLVGWGLSAIFGSQIAGGIGSVGGGAAAISTGISLCAFGPWGIVAGVALIAVGGLTIAFGVNEIIDGATGNNCIQDWTGWNDSVYNGVYTSLNIASAVGSTAGNIGMRFASNKILNAIIQDPSKINNYKLWQIKTFGKYTSMYSSGTLKKGGHVGQGYTLTNNRNASFGYIQWHPGGGHHGVSPYWKITSSFHKAVRFDYWKTSPL